VEKITGLGRAESLLSHIHQSLTRILREELKKEIIINVKYVVLENKILTTNIIYITSITTK
jgi:hypothetical protein